MAPEPDLTDTAIPIKTRSANLFGILSLVALVGIPALCGLAGYAGGLRQPDTELLLAPAFYFFSTALSFTIVVTTWISWLLNNRMRAACVIFYLPLLFFFYHFTYCAGQMNAYGCVRADRDKLRQYGKALEMYHSENGAYPLALDSPAFSADCRGLKFWHRGGLDPNPQRSAFNQDLTLRYALTDSDTTTGSKNVWLLWLPGPDQKYDIEEGPELKRSLMQLKDGVIAPWLCERIYDPTNGASSGDMVMYKILLERH